MIARPALQAEDANAVKSPASIAGGRNKRGVVRRVLTQRRPLIAAEEKQLVLHDRPADRAAELIALECVAARSKCVARVEHSISNEFKQVAVNFVRSGLGHKADRARRLHAFIGRASAGFNLELLQRIRKRHGQVAVVLRILMMSAVQGVSDSGVQSACHRKRRGGKRVSAVAVVDGRRHGATRESDQVDDISSIQRQIKNSGVFHNLTDTYASCLDLRRVRLDFDLFADLADFQRRIDRRDWR